MCTHYMSCVHVMCTAARVMCIRILYVNIYMCICMDALLLVIRKYFFYM